MPARLRCCYYSIAIAWVTIIATSHALVPSENLRSLVVEKNRRTIGSLFATDAGTENVIRAGPQRRASRNSSGFFLDRIATTTAPKYLDSRANSEAKKKSLLRMSSPEIFQDSDSLFDSDSNAPHVRVKRIANSIDARSSEKSPLSYIDRRRTPQKIYKRFAIEGTNPADENEAEYSNFDEGNVDVPGNAFLDDEISRKRNHLEDIYPEVTDLPKTEESRAKRSNIADRRKRHRLHRDEDNEEEYEDVDCVDDEDSYYDDETEDRQTDSRSDNYEEEEEEKEQKMNKRTSSSKASEAKSDRESDRLSESGRNSKVADDEEQLAALKGKSSSVSSTSSKKSYKDTQTKEKTKPKPNKPNDGKSKDDKKKPANSNKDKTKSESKPSKSKAKPKPTDKKKDKKRAKPTSKSKSSKKAEKNTAPAVHKVTTESIANVDSHDDGDDKCAEEEEDNVAEEVDDRERLKRNKSILVKAIPRGDSVKELQIFQRADNSKKKTDKSDKKSMVPRNKIQSETTLGKSDKYIGEVKDLLDKLIVKVDDLHNLVSEMRSTRDNRQQLVDEKITRSNFPVDSRRPRPCSSRRSSSSSSVLWSPWTRWSSCSVSCGRGSQTRDRRCLGGCDHQLDTESQTRVCHLPECPPAKFLGIF